MTVERSDRPCPDCGRDLQVIYVTELEQVVAGWACSDCGFTESGAGETDSVPLSEPEEYVLRIERPLTTADADPRRNIREEFRARANSEIAPGEVWQLIDPEDGLVVDVVAGEDLDD